MLGAAKGKMAERMMGQITPSELPIAQALADSVVGVENEQAQAVQRLIDATGLDVAHGHDPAARREALLNVANAVASDDFRGWWFENVAPDFLDNAGHAEKYAQLECEEWADQLRDWYQLYHERGVVDEPLADLDDPGRIAWVADRHVRAKFDVSLQEFVAIVVTWDKGEQAQQLLAGPLRRHTQIIHEAAEAVEQA